MALLCAFGFSGSRIQMGRSRVSLSPCSVGHQTQMVGAGLHVWNLESFGGLLIHMRRLVGGMIQWLCSVGLLTAAPKMWLGLLSMAGRL